MAADDPERYPNAEVTAAVIGAFFDVYNELGSGFVESVYANALAWLLEAQGWRIDQECPLPVFFRGHKVGEFKADLVVECCVVVELKAVSMLARVHEVQLLNYLRASRIDTGLLLNFGPKAEIRRRVVSVSPS